VERSTSKVTGRIAGEVVGRSAGAITGRWAGGRNTGDIMGGLVVP
jgi:hypothetical protein